MTASIIAVNVLVFVMELGREAFVTTWSLHPADIVAGHHLITILSSMFMHAAGRTFSATCFLWPSDGNRRPHGPGGYLVSISWWPAATRQVAAARADVPNLGAVGDRRSHGRLLVTYPRDGFAPSRDFHFCGSALHPGGTVDRSGLMHS